MDCMAYEFQLFFMFTPTWEWSNFTNIFQMGWNHHLGKKNNTTTTLSCTCRPWLGWGWNPNQPFLNMEGPQKKTYGGRWVAFCFCSRVILHPQGWKWWSYARGACASRIRRSTKWGEVATRTTSRSLVRQCMTHRIHVWYIYLHVP